jgi:hypothetical protein
MKKILVICAAAAFAPVAAADLVEITLDMAGTSVDDPSFVYGAIQEQNALAGDLIMAVGVRDLVIDFGGGPLDSATVNFYWTLDLTNAGYGAGIFALSGAQGPFPSGSQESYSFEFDISGYGGQVMAADYYGDWNMGTFIGSDTGGDVVSVASGEMYFIVETAIPAPGAFALLGLAGMAGRRRRRG